MLLGLLLGLQYPLWFGHASWPRVHALRQQLAQQQDLNASLADRNAALAAEVLDLKQGVGAIEERARMELGMVRKDELFFQILDAPSAAAMPDPLAPVPVAERGEKLK